MRKKIDGIEFQSATVRSREPSGCGAAPRKVTGGVESPVERYQPYNREG